MTPPEIEIENAEERRDPCEKEKVLREFSESKNNKIWKQERNLEYCYALPQRVCHPC